MPGVTDPTERGKTQYSRTLPCLTVDQIFFPVALRRSELVLFRRDGEEAAEAGEANNRDRSRELSAIIFSLV